jgi:hypothetical protein
MPEAAQGVMVETVTLLEFTGLNRPVALVGCDELAPILRDLLRGWDIRETTGMPATEAESRADIVIRRTDRGYLRKSPFLSEPSVFRDPVNSVCDFLVDFVKAYIADHPPLLCLHTAAVAFGGGLMLFPGAYKVGKSILSVQCAASGFRLFADDVLPVDGATKSGIAPGILPRLRVPLPDGVGAAFRDLVTRRESHRSDRFLYVDLGPDQLAPFGTTAPITAIILPARSDAGPPELAKIKGSEALKRMILQNFSRDMPALDILDLLHDIVADADCFELRYGSGEEAVDLLRRNFGMAT